MALSDSGSTAHTATVALPQADTANGSSTNNGQATLPQTDESASSDSALVMVGAGMTIMAATLAYGATRRKRHGTTIMIRVTLLVKTTRQFEMRKAAQHLY